MSGTIHTDPNLPSEERDRIFLEKLRVLPNEELARNIEGYFCAPNPHYVNEAARRLKQRDEKSAELHKCLKESVEAIEAVCEQMGLSEQLKLQPDYQQWRKALDGEKSE